MYVGISTGKNPNYGEKGEKTYICNNLVGYCRKENILTNIRKAGSGRLVIRDAESGEEIR